MYMTVYLTHVTHTESSHLLLGWLEIGKPCWHSDMILATYNFDLANYDPVQFRNSKLELLTVNTRCFAEYSPLRSQ